MYQKSMHIDLWRICGNKGIHYVLQCAAAYHTLCLYISSLALMYDVSLSVIHFITRFNDSMLDIKW